MSRRNGLEPTDALTQAQRQAAAREVYAFQPLPAPPGSAPYRLSTAALDIGAALPTTLGGVPTRFLHIVGDHGGIANPVPQQQVVAAMVADLASNPSVALCYSVGDIAYFNGAAKEYPPQFFEAYAHYLRTIVGIPGNHDGDPEEDGEASLQAFVKYLCDQRGPRLLPEMAEFNRDTVQQPNVYWTLLDDEFTIIGLYTNVPSGGQVEADQETWFRGELEAAPKDRPLIVALHHPPYSVDAMHGGSVHMGELLDRSFKAETRWPDLVVSGHVHDYQRFTRQVALPDGSAGRYECQIPYLVVGASGYHNLHALAKGASPGMSVGQGVVFEFGEAKQWGFLRLGVSKQAIVGEYVGVAKDGTVTPGLDTFNFPFVPSA